MSLSPPVSAIAPVLRVRLDTIKEAWRQGGRADALAALSREPDLLNCKGALIDLACEEFYLRLEAGEDVDPDAFCEGFPAFQTSLRRALHFDSLFENLKESLPEPVRGTASQKSPTEWRFRLPPQPARWPGPGEAVGDLLLLRELGRGAFARVFLAAEESTGDRPVAVKLTLEGGTEARTLGPLAHPNVVPVLSCRLHPGTGLTAICMPFLGSATLEDVRDWLWGNGQSAASNDRRSARTSRCILEAVRTTAAPDDPPATVEGPADHWLQHGSCSAGVLHLGVQLAGALAFLHSNGVFHRDLKPSNILLGPDGRPRLLDFNLAVCLDRQGGAVGGTLPYAAPEQIRALLGHCLGSASPPDGRADLYSLAVILYELLTGRHPFGPISERLPPEILGPMLLERQAAGCPPLRADDLDAPVTRLLERCLAFDPNHRPKGATDLALGLRAYFRPRRRLLHWAGRHWRTLLAVMTLATIGAVALCWSASAYLKSPPPPSKAQEAFRQGREAFNAGRFEESEERFAVAMAEDPEDPQYRFARACALLKRGQTKSGNEAFNLFSAAGAAFPMPTGHPREGLAHLCMAYCYARISSPFVAVENADSALEKGFPPTTALLNNRAYSYIQISKLSKAAEDLEAVRSEERNLPEVCWTRASLARKYRLQDPKTFLPRSAVDDVCRALEAWPTDCNLEQLAADLNLLSMVDEAQRLTILTSCTGLLAIPQGPLAAARAVVHEVGAAQAVAHLRAALEKGGDPKVLPILFLEPVSRRADFLALPAKALQENTQEFFPLIDPIPAFPDY
jgi:serine/threonine protein kinase